MAPFLVILLLLALGAGIVAWHTIGYPHGPQAPTRSRPKPRQITRDVAPTAPATQSAPEPLSPPEAPQRPVRLNDPFAHAPLPDREDYP